MKRSGEALISGATEHYILWRGGYNYKANLGLGIGLHRIENLYNFGT